MNDVAAGLACPREWCQLILPNRMAGSLSTSWHLPKYAFSAVWEFVNAQVVLQVYQFTVLSILTCLMAWS
jgi:hypothetical protein